MRSSVFVVALVVAGGLLFSGCEKPADTGKDKTYDLKGKVVAVDPAGKTVTLDHEDIPGLMKAMTMKFEVADAKLLDGVAVGDAVEGKLKADQGRHVVTELRKR